MKSSSLHIGSMLIIASIAASGRDRVPSETIARTFGGEFMEVVIQTQQRAQKGDETPTFIEVGRPLIIENWVEGATIPPGRDGRISTFQPPRQIIVGGYIYQVGKALGDATRSSGRRKTEFTTITDQPVGGTPPDGYHWTGEIRIATRAELVTWRRDWQYIRLKPANAEQGADDQLPASAESEAE